MDYGAMKSSKNGDWFLRKLSVLSRQKQTKISIQNCLLNLNCLNNLSRWEP